MNGSEKHYLERLLDPEDRDMIEKEEHFSQVMMMYSCAIREVQTKLEVLNDDLKSRYQRNPIHSIKSRIKKPVSLAKKLRKKGLPVSVDSIKGNINDVAGVRVICSFVDDIYTISEMLTSQTDITLISQKDYIEHPKPNGYRSYHMIIKLPVHLPDCTRELFAEIQLRTIAMDCWAALEHELKYKHTIPNQELLQKELKRCSDEMASTDLTMQTIRQVIDHNEADRKGTI